MKRDLSTLSNRDFDLIVIGAGAFGSCSAWEAASRGLSVALVERGDFCGATSANHLKMVHGGIRYLQHLDVYRVRESCRERTILSRIAPHLVHPIPIILPTLGHGTEGKGILSLGLFLYDLITFDRNSGINDSARQIPRGRILSRKKCLELFPQLAETGINGAGIFYDGQFYNPPRLALSFLKSAESLGARIGNYAEVKGFLKTGNRVCGVSVEDKISQEKFEIRSKIVINTAGPWANNLLKSSLGFSLNPEPRFSRDLGFVIKKKFSDNHALGVRINLKDPDAILSRKGRHVFLVPWRDYTLVGVWHLIFNKNPDNITVSREELQSYIDEINAAIPALELNFDDITMVNTGLTLFGDNDSNKKDLSFGKRSILVDHAVEHQIEGVISLIGVRATIARAMAEKAINLAFEKLGKKFVISRTHELPIHGGRFAKFETLLNEAKLKTNNIISPEVVQSLLHNHGARYQDILKYIKEDVNLGDKIGDSSTIKAEIIHAVREEMAVRLSDVVFRRTELGTGEYPPKHTIQICAEIMGAELKWHEDKKKHEIDDLEKSLFLKFR